MIPDLARDIDRAAVAAYDAVPAWLREPQQHPAPTAPTAARFQPPDMEAT